MKKLILVSLLGLFATSAQAELPSMCFDGTYVGGSECEIVVNGERVEDGLVADDFFKSQEELMSDLNDLLILIQESSN